MVRCFFSEVSLFETIMLSKLKNVCFSTFFYKSFKHCKMGHKKMSIFQKNSEIYFSQNCATYTLFIVFILFNIIK